MSEKNLFLMKQEHDELRIILVGLINSVFTIIIFPNKNTNSVKNAIAPKISPAIPPRAFLDFSPRRKLINIINIIPSNMPLRGKLIMLAKSKLK